MPNRLSWARHVLGDLMPYLCLYPNCPAPNQLYESRRDWFDHLRTQHSVSGHYYGYTDCPLYRESVRSGKVFERHLGHHMEELAFFALPTSEKANEEDASDDQEDTSEDREDMSDEINHEGRESPTLNLYSLVG
ncbi:hypothetical protein N7481_002473 [Penicillium waksmanii]|uniref:uncharacterized protein n=1 Tax=Penicillium waksmanii TaxID=69791 RepID=UPI002548296B|nr:uncharacterized protein N7481_002473 [Penicillium waksmanii]KAJ5995496.1 hypothetical protein N7481_002473 [Penicillium waksmanii]